MKVEPLRIESALKRASPLRGDLATQQNNWLQNEIVQSSSTIRTNELVKSSVVVQTQPMPTPIQDVAPLQNCPPGLEYLASVDQLLVQQKVELIEAITGK